MWFCLPNFGSIYLGYILYSSWRTCAFVCVAIYATNFLLLIASFAKMRVHSLRNTPNGHSRTRTTRPKPPFAYLK
ncbi:hypothetical protein TCAL_17429 [Tigriopus californicus]|uniref:Uncharacterized protein n=1 Tax=Tigriopus californicus TaxID=6832 RepID=A0A553PFB8_TIGCA|nr:hypothetical protein TCAL_17429 [Tigriopus californicus]